MSLCASLASNLIAAASYNGSRRQSCRSLNHGLDSPVCLNVPDSSCCCLLFYIQRGTAAKLLRAIQQYLGCVNEHLTEVSFALRLIQRGTDEDYSVLRPRPRGIAYAHSVSAHRHYATALPWTFSDSLRHDIRTRDSSIKYYPFISECQ